MANKKNINASQIARSAINGMVDKMRENGNSLLVQIMDYRGDNLKEYLAKTNPERAHELNQMFENKEFVDSLETIKNIR